MASLLRRDQSSVQSSDLRSVLTQPRETYDLTTEKVRTLRTSNTKKTIHSSSCLNTHTCILLAVDVVSGISWHISSFSYFSYYFICIVKILILYFYFFLVRPHFNHWFNKISSTLQTVIEGQPGSDCSPRRFPTQRPGLSTRSIHPPPRIGIRLPNRPIANLTSSAPGAALLRLQTTGGQGATHTERNPSPQQAVQDTGGRGGLQDQIQTLGSEVRSLGLAVKMLIEQQCRLEREHSQQTQIQKQILSTLQTLSSKMVQCSSALPKHNKTPSPSSLPAASASFSQDTFSFSQGTYAQCSQTQPSYNSLESLENVEAFKLPGLRPTSMNGFPPCSNAESLPLTHTPPQTQPYAAAYPQQTSQSLMTPYTQSYVSTYNQSHTQSFRTPESKTSDFSSSCSSGSFQDCSISTQQVMNSNQPSQDQQISTIKVEGP